MKFNKPKFWDKKKPTIFSFLLLLLTVPLVINNFLKQSKKHNNKSKNYTIKTICVGNIYLGGTGKTPSAIKISQILNDLKYRTVFIKKNHSETFDEEKLLKKYGKVLSYSKRENSLSEANKFYDVAIFDDGLQDNSINYNLKFVCFNTNIFIGNGMLIPAGPLREKINSLKKYDAVFLNGDAENMNDIITQIKKYKKDIKIFKSEYNLINLNSFDKKEKYIAFAGIGFPKNFFKTLIYNNFNIVKFLEFPDHYNYNYKDIKKIIDISNDFNAKILTTEKDYERIRASDSQNIDYIRYVKMELKIKEESELIDFIQKNL